MRKAKLEFTVGPGGWLHVFVRAESGELESDVSVRFAQDADGVWQPDGAIYVLPLTPENLRVLPLRRITIAVAASDGLQASLASRLDEDVPEVGSNDFLAKLAGFVHPELSPLKRPAGRNLPDEFYATVADRYRDAIARGLNPRTAIAEAASVSTDVAGRWVREARKPERGFLPPTQPGKVGV